MAIKEIREFGDFSGANNEGYIIIGGKTASVEGGKKLLSDVIPNVPQADEETITNNNGELKVTNPIPDPTDHYDAILCVEEHDNNLIWSDDRDEPFDAYDVRMAISTSRKYIDEDSHDYPLYLNSSGGLSMASSENEGDVLTTTVNGIEWTPPPAQLQADWEQEDDTQKDYIKNKPDISNKIESISIDGTEIVPDENKNVNIGLGNWLNIDSDNNIEVIPNYGGGTGGLKYDDGELSVMLDRKTIVYDADDNLSVNYDDTLTIVNKTVPGSLLTKYLSVKNPVPDPTGHNNEVLSYKTSEGIVWSSPLNSLYNLGDISIDTGLNGISDKFGSGRDKPLLVPTIEATEINEDDTSSYPVKKIAMNSETVFDLVNENLQVKWPDPKSDFPAQSQIGDTIEYKLVAELTGFAPNGRQQISLSWTKAT